jgi:tyrosine-protein phosphatase non-receptor type 23
METCPKIQMLSFDMKLCNYDITDFSEKLFTYIYTHYQENPENYQKEMSDLLQLRDSALNASRDFMGLNLLKKYYHQLQLLSNRFPMKSTEECETEFSWDELYNEKEIVHNDVRFEQENILYNIGALHSYLACLDKRNNDEGIKISCTHFQYAAWAFQAIKDSYSSIGLTSDLNEEVMLFKVNTMLAQAQECVLEKSIIDNRKHSINAKISFQIIEYYKLAMSFLERSEFQSSVGSRRTKVGLNQVVSIKIKLIINKILFISGIETILSF